MLLECLILSVLIGLLRGGSLKNFYEIKIKFVYLAFISVLIEYALLNCILYTDLITPIVVFIMIILQYSLLFVFFFLNGKFPSIVVMGAGTFLNFLVIILNKGAMPLSKSILSLGGNSIKYQLLEQGKLMIYHVINSKTPLWYLGDVIYIPFPLRQFISAGDIVLVIGVFLFIQSVMLNRTCAFYYQRKAVNLPSE